MTKSDVLDAFEELAVCTSYGIDGEQEKSVPYQLNKVSIDPSYKKFTGWMTDISKIKQHADLPAAMKVYIDFINQYLGVPVTHISNGPERDQLITV